MSEDFKLTPGCCTFLHDSPADGSLIEGEFTVQFLSVKKVGSAADRYRLIISDGEHFVQAMLATQCNGLVESDEIKKFTVATVDRASCNYVQQKRLVILLSVQVLGTPSGKIGNPKALDEPEKKGEAPMVGTSDGPKVKVEGNAENAPSTFPIEGLSPYQNNWTIKARVTQKSDIKTWSNSRGEGKLFNVTLMDDSGEIRATAFNHVVDELFSRLEEGKVYYLSRARVNFAKKKFNNLPNDYELTLERNTHIEECHESSALPQMKFNFVPLDQLESLGKDSMTDVIGVIKEVGPLSEITTRTTNRQLQKRELTLVDKTECSVQLTLWGKQAETFKVEANSIAAFKSIRVGDFGGVSLSMVSSSQMQINPQIPECYTLRGWYDDQGASTQFQAKTVVGGGGGASFGYNRAEARSLNEIKDLELGMNDKPDFFSTRATIVHIRGENLFYPACTSQNCSKKMTDEGDSWVCDKCGNRAEQPEYRYIVSMAVADWSGQAWLQAFNDPGFVIFGMSANQLQELKLNDDGQYEAAIHKAHCHTYNFSCRAKKDSFDDRVRVRYGISRIERLEYAEEGRHLIELLRSPWAQ
ncbi:Replication factor A protein 1 [Leucoagaricus sp. SymC.cos]|nr:Replication factor A protein 1 [Leucoagaricus sp. SymC.cos]